MKNQRAKCNWRQTSTCGAHFQTTTTQATGRFRLQTRRLRTRRIKAFLLHRRPTTLDNDCVPNTWVECGCVMCARAFASRHRHRPPFLTVHPLEDCHTSTCQSKRAHITHPRSTQAFGTRSSSTSFHHCVRAKRLSCLPSQEDCCNLSQHHPTLGTRHDKLCNLVGTAPQLPRCRCSWTGCGHMTCFHKLDAVRVHVRQKKARMSVSHKRNGGKKIQ